MGRRLIVVLLIAGLIAAGTAYLSRQLLQQQPQMPMQTATGTAPAPVYAGAKVLVATKDLPAGTIIQPASLTFRAWPAEGVDKQTYVTEDSGRVEEFSGDVLRAGVRQGEPLVRSNIIKKGENGFLAAVLKPGMRAITIQVNEIFGVAGFVFPGDNVDIIMSHDVQMLRADGTGTVPHKVSETILKNIRVIAIGQIANDQGVTPQVANAVTLEVTPEQAEQIALASQIGQLRLSLRSMRQEETTATEGAATGTEQGGGEALAPSLSQFGITVAQAPDGKPTYTLDSDLSLVIAPPAGGESGHSTDGAITTKVDVYRGNSMSSSNVQSATSGTTGDPSGMVGNQPGGMEVGAGPIY